MRGIVRKGGWLKLAAAVVGISCLAGFVGGQAMAAGGSGVLRVRLGGDSTETRIVVDLDRAATGKVLSDGDGDRHVVLNLSGVNVDGALKGDGRGVVSDWAIERSGGGAQLKIGLAADATIKRRFLLPPADGVANYRYVIDIASKTPVQRLAKADRAVLTAQTITRAPPISLKKTIVIDAGHGGKDPGAQGAAGVEKDVTLAAAKALRDRLERTGRYRVVMTRDSDVYVPLDERVQIARRADADLFISLHADSGPDSSTHGASVYTLADRAVARSAKLVTKDDWFMKASLDDRNVSGILFDLTQRATKNRSATFAEMLLDRVSDEQPLLRRSHREAGLAVLLAPDVPAVLLEMGFITSPDDEQVLSDASGRGRLMSAVASSIDSYFDQETRLAAR